MQRWQRRLGFLLLSAHLTDSIYRITGRADDKFPCWRQMTPGGRLVLCAMSDKNPAEGWVGPRRISEAAIRHSLRECASPLAQLNAGGSAGVLCQNKSATGSPCRCVKPARGFYISVLELHESSCLHAMHPESCRCLSPAYRALFCEHASDMWILRPTALGCCLLTCAARINPLPVRINMH